MPIEILQKEVQVRDPTTHQFSDLAALRGGQGPQGATGPGVPAGGTDGDVLVKNGTTDYAANWTKTPPQMGSLAAIESSPATAAHNKDDFIVYNGSLYAVTSNISAGNSLIVGGNIRKTDVASEFAPRLTVYVSTVIRGQPFPGHTTTDFLLSDVIVPDEHQFITQGNLNTGYIRNSWIDIATRNLYVSITNPEDTTTFDDWVDIKVMVL